MLHLVFLFIIGTVVGSFLNVCIHRLPRGESIIFPASRCPQCGQRLSPLDLIPVLGYLFLRGKCRYCHSPISFRYPLVEFGSGVFFVGAALSFPAAGLPRDFCFSVIFLCLMLIVFFTDLELQLIPDAISVSGIFSGLTYNFLRGMLSSAGRTLAPLYSAISGMLLGYAIFYLISRLGRMVFKKDVMGEGDLFLAALLGAYLGWQGALLAIFLAYLLAALVLVGLMALGRIKTGQYVPFGPALAAGGVITLFFEQQIISWYLQRFFYI
jgi:leader peptidase (prepilin peptidase)/N-methyltransferase